jgi:hypothetical protein
VTGFQLRPEVAVTIPESAVTFPRNESLSAGRRCEREASLPHIVFGKSRCGSGKTYLAFALAENACRSGLSAWYVRAPRLFEELSLCHADSTFSKRLAAIARVQLHSVIREPAS